MFKATHEIEHLDAKGVCALGLALTIVVALLIRVSIVRRLSVCCCGKLVQVLEEWK